jgi:ABC-type branched-subunit amino acid transport system ATPase component/branched-subunit amino acid ABC-type transport system permease component
LKEYFEFFVLGLSLGSVYAAITLGIVLTYLGTGVINFAAAAIATVALYVFSDLKSGKLTFLLPWIPSFHVGVPPTWLAVVIALAVAAALGALIQVVVSRPLRRAPVLAKVIAAVGISVTLQAGLALKFGTNARVRADLLPTGTVVVGGARLPIDGLWLILITVVASVALAVWLRKSRMGLGIRAAAENEQAASFARLSPQTLGMVTWVLSSVFTASILILAGPATGVIEPDNLTLLVIPALAGALIAKLTSVPLGLLGALGVGVVTSELQYLSSDKTWWPSWGVEGLTDAVPFIIIVITLFMAGRSIPMRGDDNVSRLPPVILPRNRPPVVGGLVVAGFVLLALTSGTYRFGVITSLALALITLSLVLLTGMVGQISLAQAGFAGVAGFMVSKFGTSIPFPLTLLAAAVIAGIVGVFVGLPALRIRGAQLAVVTLAAALAMQDFVFANPSIVNPNASLIPNPKLFGINLSIRGGRDIARLPFGVFVLIVVAAAFVLVTNLMRAGSGRKMLAVRSNERAASSIGISVSGVKLSAFGLSSFLAGLGGALIGYSRGQMSAASFSVLVGLSFLAIAYLGGITSASGGLVAGAIGSLGIVYVILDQNVHVGNYYTLLSGLSLILTVILNPLGIAGKTRADFDKTLAKRAARRGGAAEPATAEVAPPVVAAVSRRIGELVLRTVDVSVRYGGVQAVKDVCIEVREGEIVGLIGPNGAGKTSFIDAITGFTPSTGQVFLGTADLRGKSAHRRARRGLVRTWQSVELFEDLSVSNNVRVSDDIGSDGWKFVTDMFRPNPPPSAAVSDAMGLMALTDVAERRPSELSLGRQKTLGVARSLAMRPRVLLLDEPAAGLDTAESLEFGQHLRQIAATGVGCLLVDHDMGLVLGVCDRIYVIEFGAQIADGTPAEVRANDAVVAAYLGSGHLDPEKVSGEVE